MITVSAFRRVPPIVHGLVRDLRVRWALEEAGRPYEQRLIGPEDQASDAYRALQPFGQVPTYEEDGLALFESGAILHHIAQGSPALSPGDDAGRARMLTWMFAALNSVEPIVQQLAEMDLFNAGADWVKERRPVVAERVKGRLAALSKQLEGRDYLLDRFTAADILMSHVLHLANRSGALEGFPALQAYLTRCEARPAYKAALADHMAAFES